MGKHNLRQSVSGDLEEVVDELEAEHVHTPEPDQKVAPGSATTDGTDDPGDDRAGESEPPD
jgi:hypothetical protein